MTPDTRSTAIALLSELTRRGLSLRADGESIKVRPPELLTDHDRQRIAASRPAVLAILRQRVSPQSTEAHAKSEDGVSVGGNAPATCVKWMLDRLDVRVLLAAGWLPTPDVGDLPPNYRAHYERTVHRLVEIGISVERAEFVAQRETLDAMVADGRFVLTDWGAE